MKAQTINFKPNKILAIPQNCKQKAPYVIAPKFLDVIEESSNQLNLPAIGLYALQQKFYNKSKEIKEIIKTYGRENEFNEKDISDFAHQPDKQFERIKNLLPTKKFRTFEIKNISVTTDEMYEKIQKILTDNQYDTLSGYDILSLTKLVPDVTDRILNLKIPSKTLSDVIQQCIIIQASCINKNYQSYMYYAIDDENEEWKDALIRNYSADQKTVKYRHITSGEILGFPNISEIDKNGNIKAVQWSSIDPNYREIRAERHFLSPLGIKSDFDYTENDLMKILNYTIRDKDGTNLLDRHMTFEKISDSDFLTSINNRLYKSKFNGKHLTVTDLKTKQKNRINLSRLEGTNDKFIIDILKNIPANLLMVIDKLPLDEISYGSCNQDNGTMITDIRGGKKILLGEVTNKNDLLKSAINTFLHEYGHYITSDIASENVSLKYKTVLLELQKTFNKEYQIFKKTVDPYQQQYLQYLTTSANAYSERYADTIMLLNGLPDYITGKRTTYFTEYFPETIALISKISDMRIDELQSKSKLYWRLTTLFLYS
ncbi:MAG: hypothetical protein MJ237_01405 [bacterium]|nr:hypothetical protein [bacterium]